MSVGDKKEKRSGEIEKCGIEREMCGNVMR